jgi:hypothetical protein
MQMVTERVRIELPERFAFSPSAVGVPVNDPPIQV